MPHLKHSKVCFLFVLCILFSSCTVRNFDRPKRNTNTAPGKKLSAFERELKAMRDADFDYIFVLKRKDGKAFDKEDKSFVRTNRYYAANRSTFTRDEKVLFIGSNFEFPEKNLKALKERFEFEDYSKPKEQIEKEKKERESANQKANQEKEPESKVNRDNLLKDPTDDNSNR